MIKFREKKRTAWFGLPIYFTSYTITDELLQIKEGLLNIRENDCFIYKIQDITLTKGLIERLFGLGTIICYTGDTTNSEIVLKHIRNSRTIKEYLLRQSDEEKMRRRIIHTSNIDAEDVLE